MLVGGLQVLEQLLILLLQLPYQLGFWILVLDRQVLNRAGLDCVVQSREIFLQKNVSRGDACDHQAKAVSADAALEQTGELGVSVGDMRALRLLLAFPLGHIG